MIKLLAATAMMSSFVWAATQAAAELSGCSYGGIDLWGAVEVVDSFGDIKVEIVDSFADLKVEEVDNFADDCGEWEFVDNFGDFTIEFVDSFGDITIEYVDNFPGLP